MIVGIPSRLAGPCVVICALLVACTGGDGSPPREGERSRNGVGITLDSLATGLLTAGLRSHERACTTAEAGHAALQPADSHSGMEDTPGRVALLVFADAERALSCRRLGFGLRRALRSAARQGGSVVLVVPVADTAIICDFLRRERAPISVLPLDTMLWRDVAGDSRVAFVLPMWNSQPGRLIELRDGAVLDTVARSVFGVMPPATESHPQPGGSL